MNVFGGPRNSGRSSSTSSHCRQRSARAAACDMRQLRTQSQSDQMCPNELPRGQAAALLVRQLPRPHHQLEGHLLSIRASVGTLGDEHVPDDDQPLAIATTAQAVDGRQLQVWISRPLPAAIRMSLSAPIEAALVHNLAWRKCTQTASVAASSSASNSGR